MFYPQARRTGIFLNREEHRDDFTNSIESKKLKRAPDEDTQKTGNPHESPAKI